MDRSALRARCHQRVNDLLSHIGLPYPWDINQFLDRLERHRGRDIDLCAISWSPGNSCGAWQQYPDYDVIAYAENTSSFHQDHIILHEIGHMIADHTSDEQDDDLLLDLQIGITPDHVRRALRRSSYDSEHEREAELVATIILGWASVLDVVAPRTGPDPVYPHLGSALDGRIGWL
jgi:Zn-dependent peptidase ImmA (M78 family)